MLLYSEKLSKNGTRVGTSQTGCGVCRDNRCKQCRHRIGGELAQPDDDGNLHPVTYFSRCLTKRERSYPTYDREVLAIRDTLKHYRY